MKNPACCKYASDHIEYVDGGWAMYCEGKIDSDFPELNYCPWCGTELKLNSSRTLRSLADTYPNEPGPHAFLDGKWVKLGD